MSATKCKSGERSDSVFKPVSIAFKNWLNKKIISMKQLTIYW